LKRIFRAIKSEVFDMKKKKQIFLITYFSIFFMVCTITLVAARNLISAGQSVYVPAYSSIFHGDKQREFELSVTLSIRNTNSKNSILLSVVDYYDTKGKRIKVFIKEPQKISPLESRQFIISESDLSGGVGANFIVTWSSEKKVNPPLIESIMIGTKGQQGISFSMRGVPVQDDL
jgi:hypothetical protein